jgi:hypothetical protein
MGNQNSVLVNGRYQLTAGKESYAVVLGNEIKSAQPSNGTVGRKLEIVEKILQSCKVKVMVPFLSRGTDVQANFNKEDFDRICLMHFDQDMLRNLDMYSSFFIYYHGPANEKGIITNDGYTFTINDMVSTVSKHSMNCGKPIVFIFDLMLFPNQPSGDIKLIKNFTDCDKSPLNNTLIFVTYQYHSAGMFTMEFPRTLQQFHCLLPISDILAIVAVKTKLKLNTDQYFEPEVLDTLVGAFILCSDELPTDLLGWTSYSIGLLEDRGEINF